MLRRKSKLLTMTSKTPQEQKPSANPQPADTTLNDFPPRALLFVELDVVDHLHHSSPL